ncbi:MAG: M20/M25/M40 family metallo-hydrolase, partial [Bacteroidota bacterium]
MKRISICIFLIISLFTASLTAQSLNSKQLDGVINSQLPQTLYLHREFARLPNDAAIPEDMPANIEWLEKQFGRRGFEMKRLETGSIPLLLAEQKSEAADAPTVLMYFHFDGQPVDPTKWDQPDPFEPVLKTQLPDGSWQALSYDRLREEINPEWRIFGRAAADDKGPILMLLRALDLMRQLEKSLPFHLKVLLDGEEEKGSKGLLQSLKLHQSLFAADHFLILDGPEHMSRKPTLTFGCRGIARGELTVYGPATPQHSGHYGNYAPNPTFRLAQLLSSMKAPDGKVLVAGYYEQVQLSAAEKKQLAAIPAVPELMRKQLGIAAAEAVGDSYQEALQYPTLNIPAMGSGDLGLRRTIIPGEAIAKLEMRLVKETPGDSLIRLVRQHIEGQGYLVLDREPSPTERLQYPLIAKYSGSTSVNAFRTDPQSPTGQWL